MLAEENEGKLELDRLCSKQQDGLEYQHPSTGHQKLMGGEGPFAEMLAHADTRACPGHSAEGPVS